VDSKIAGSWRRERRKPSGLGECARTGLGDNEPSRRSGRLARLVVVIEDARRLGHQVARGENVI
jgi:hypothetical protein